MADTEDLHQIEYRHHQTNDLSPFASSMASLESLEGWHSRIRAWVRHPHADKLSESAFYQVFPAGKAALAWRYWDATAASRDDGTLGRPLVSRVLVGPETVLAPETAVAACRAGLSAEWAGPLPGQVEAGDVLPKVSHAALTALVRQTAGELDQAAMIQTGLQAVVAAALAEQALPLAISVHNDLIQMPLREGVQCPLLWGLGRIAGQLHDPAARGWSFSTFELPLGEMDPSSLPGIVFRETQDGPKVAPSRFRREAKVRPFEDGALNEGTFYAGTLELADWLIAEYRQRGGPGLERFIAECGGNGPFAARRDQILAAFHAAHRPRRIRGLFEAPSAGRETRPGEDTGTAAAKPTAAQQASAEPDEPGAEARHPGGQRAQASPLPNGQAVETQSPPQGTEETRAGSEHEGERISDAAVGGTELPDPHSFPADEPPVTDEPPGADEDAADELIPDRADDGYGGSWPPDGPLAPAREAETVPPRMRPEREQHSADMWPSSERPGSSPRGGQESPSGLLQALELLSPGQRQFESVLDAVYQFGDLTGDERGRCWDVISSPGWYETISENNEFRREDLPRIFRLVVIPDLAEQPSGEVLARWALDSAPLMIGGLITAAQMTGTDMHQTVIELLEPALAYRWIIENCMKDHWDARRIARPSAGSGRDDTGRGFPWWNRPPKRK